MRGCGAPGEGPVEGRGGEVGGWGSRWVGESVGGEGTVQGEWLGREHVRVGLSVWEGTGQTGV